MLVSLFLCPSCPLATRVWWTVLHSGFWTNLGIAVLPFAVIGAVTYVAHGVGR
jgi:hypothetical protein